MRDTIIGLLFTLIILMVSCQSDHSVDLEKQISDLEQILFEQQEGVINKKDAAEIIHLYSKFVNEYPESDKAAVYLFKAADVSINVFHSEQTIMLYNKLLNQYPNYEKTPQALFLKAFTFENYLNNIDSARYTYELFLQKYPEHTFANDAQVSLSNLGKSPEEIIKSFKKNP